VANVQAGDKVKVIGGGYNGSEGVVESVEGELAKVQINSFGIPMSARVELTQLEKVDGETS
jgi:transcription antitermination factor NusG